MADLGGALGQSFGLGADRLGLTGDPFGPLEGLGHAVLSRALVQPGQLRTEGGETGGEVVRPQTGAACGVQGVGGGEQSLPGAFDGGRQPGQLGLRLAEQGAEALGEVVEFLLDPAQLGPGGGQFRAGVGGGGRFQVVPVQVVGVDGADVLVADLVDAPAQGIEVGDRAPGGGEESTAAIVSIEIRRSRWAVSSS